MELPIYIGVREGGAGGAAAIRALCRHEFGQRVDIIRAKYNTCLNNTNLGSVTATPQNMDPVKFLLLPPPPTEYGSRNGHRKISATTPPPPTESIRARPGLPAPPNGCWPVRLCPYTLYILAGLILLDYLQDIAHKTKSLKFTFHA